MEFVDFDLHPDVAAGVRAIGFVRPTPIQEKAIPPVLEGHDVMGLAQTGTGKTAAFALPILDRLIRGPRGRVRALIVVPTRELAAGYRAASLQGNLSQNRRQSALDGFRAGSYRILVATDIAARGIDVSSISHVINYDMPDTADAYTHRIGRTGRAAKTGDAFTFTTREDGEVVRSIERVLGDRVQRRTLEGFDYQKSLPGRDIEFARPPRQPQERKGKKIAKPSGNRPAASAPQNNAGGVRVKKRDQDSPGPLRFLEPLDDSSCRSRDSSSPAGDQCAICRYVNPVMARGRRPRLLSPLPRTRGPMF